MLSGPIIDSGFLTKLALQGHPAINLKETQRMKTLLSIGTGPGIGLATVQRFAREGYRVLISARDGSRLEAMAAPLIAAGIDAGLRTIDTTDAEAVAALVDSVEAESGQIEVLHYNAAAIRKASLAEQAPDTLNRDLAVNIGGALAATRAVTPHLARRGSGTILYTGGGFALHPHPDYLSLSIGKAGIRALTQALFDDYRLRGIHVATVTVAGFIGPADPAHIADAFWALHTQPQADWSAEVRYDPLG